MAPLGHPEPVETVVDTALEEYPRLWAAGGTLNTIFPTDYAELVKMTNGTPSAVN